MLGYYKLRGEILRILLVLARHPEAQLIMKDEGFGDVVADVARDRSNPAMNRTLAIKVVFTMGSRAARQTWIVRRDGSRRRRGYDADYSAETRRGDAAATTRIIPWRRVAATPRLRRRGSFRGNKSRRAPRRRGGLLRLGRGRGVLRPRRGHATRGEGA